jgi:hypothetical protein
VLKNKKFKFQLQKTPKKRLRQPALVVSTVGVVVHAIVRSAALLLLLTPDRNNFFEIWQQQKNFGTFFLYKK